MLLYVVGRDVSEWEWVDCDNNDLRNSATDLLDPLTDTVLLSEVLLHEWVDVWRQRCPVSHVVVASPVNRDKRMDKGTLRFIWEWLVAARPVTVTIEAVTSVVFANTAGNITVA